MRLIADQNQITRKTILPQLCDNVAAGLSRADDNHIMRVPISAHGKTRVDMAGIEFLMRRQP
jgi:hypothetical protein